MSENKGVVTVSFNRLVALLSGAVVAGLVGGIFTGYSITRSTAYTANANAVAISELNQECAKKDVIEVWIKSVDKRLDSIEKAIGVK